MNTYNRRGKTAEPQAAVPQQLDANEGAQRGKKVNGLQQVVDLLQAADPEFRRSLLKRIISENPELGAQLRERLAR
jgi:hypothetical protein